MLRDVDKAFKDKIRHKEAEQRSERNRAKQEGEAAVSRAERQREDAKNKEVEREIRRAQVQKGAPTRASAPTTEKWGRGAERQLLVILIILHDPLPPVAPLTSQAAQRLPHHMHSPTTQERIHPPVLTHSVCLAPSP